MEQRKLSSNTYLIANLGYKISGVLLLVKGDTARANDYFDNALKTNPKNVPAHLGKVIYQKPCIYVYFTRISNSINCSLIYLQGCIYFNNSKYEEALKCYKTVISDFPSCHPSVRLGLAYCYYKLNRLDVAKLAFERVLQLVRSVFIFISIVLIFSSSWLVIRHIVLTFL